MRFLPIQYVGVVNSIKLNDTKQEDPSHNSTMP